MTLDKAHIQFIDNYLDHSDVSYADIRMEMVDHIASEIEAREAAGDTRGFYDIFKDYMVENKALLLNNNRQFLRKVDLKNARLIAKTMCSYRGILLFTCILILSHFMVEELVVTKQVMSKSVLFLGAMLSIVPLAVFYIILSKIYGFSRFSGVERMGFAFVVLYQLLHLISILIKPFNSSNEFNWAYSLGFAISVFLIVILVIVTYKTIKIYQLKYKATI